MKKSPMECVEIVFGNLTNMELLSSRPSPSSVVNKKNSSAAKDDDFCTLRMREFEPLETGAEAARRKENIKQVHSISYSQLTTQELLRMFPRGHSHATLVNS